MKTQKSLRLIPVLCLLVGSTVLSSCSSNGDQRAEVKDVRVDPAAVSLGDQIDIQITFEPEQDGNFDSDATAEDTDLVIKLPQGVDYVDGTGELDDGGISGFDDRTPNKVELCSDGTRALTFEFSDGELNTGENRVRIKAKAYEVDNNGRGIFRAQADARISLPCAIAGDDSDSLEINP